MVPPPPTSSGKEPTYTLQDIIDDEIYLQATARAVLGASDSEQCSYKRGYVYRQAVFTCRTCQKSNKTAAGVCLACSLRCHAGHDVVELWTKRRFRCDCGTSRVDGACNFVDIARRDNWGNVYGQNFAGLYCSCNRPHPDPEHPDDYRDMLQCAMCEDWHHDNHLGCTPPDENTYDEMICPLCVRRHRFLAAYRHLSVSTTVADEDVDELSPSRPYRVESDADAFDPSGSFSVVRDDDADPSGSFSAVHDDDADEEGDDDDGDDDGEQECRVSALSNLVVLDGPVQSMFMPESWRQHLCRCNSCLAIYDREGCDYLLAENDPISVYVTRGLTPDAPADDAGSLNAVAEMELVASYADLRNRIKRRLEEVRDRDGLVTRDDVQSVFDELTKEGAKRRRLE